MSHWARGDIVVEIHDRTRRVKIWRRQDVDEWRGGLGHRATDATIDEAVNEGLEGYTYIVVRQDGEDVR